MISVTLYGKAGCCLCDEAREAVVAVQTDLGFELEEVDISLDPVLHRRYGERIPVLCVNGEEAFELRVEPAALRERLAEVDGELTRPAPPDGWPFRVGT